MLDWCYRAVMYLLPFVYLYQSSLFVLLIVQRKKRVKLKLMKKLKLTMVVLMAGGFGAGFVPMSACSNPSTPSSHIARPFYLIGYCQRDLNMMNDKNHLDFVQIYKSSSLILLSFKIYKTIQHGMDILKLLERTKQYGKSELPVGNKT